MWHLSYGDPLLPTFWVRLMRAKDKKKYAEFVDQFGIPLKEGLYQDIDHREDLLELVRFKSTTEKQGALKDKDSNKKFQTVEFTLSKPIESPHSEFFCGIGSISDAIVSKIINESY